MAENFKRCGEGDNTCNCKTESECGYLSDDGELFTDKSKYIKRQHEINMKKLKIINKTHWLESAWVFLLCFIAGYLFCGFMHIL